MQSAIRAGRREQAIKKTECKLHSVLLLFGLCVFLEGSFQPNGTQIQRVEQAGLFALFDHLLFGRDLLVRIQQLNDHFVGNGLVALLLLTLYLQAHNERVGHTAVVNGVAAAYQRSAFVFQKFAFLRQGNASFVLI